MSFRILLILSSGGPFVQWNVNICASLVESITRNNSVDFFFEFGPVVQEMSLKRFLIWSSGGPPIQTDHNSSPQPSAQET